MASQTLVLQVMAAMLQLRPFSTSLSPSPRFPGWTTNSILSILAAIPSFFFLSTRSIGRQPTTRHRSPLKPRPLRLHTLAVHRDPSRIHLGVSQALAFYSWVESHCGFIHNESTCRAMCRILAKSNNLRILWRFLRSNQTLVTTTTITSIIKVLGDEGLAKEALAAFYRMKQLHCKPDVIAYNTLISALCRIGDFKTARSLLEQMELPGARCSPDTYTYTILIGYYCRRSMETGCRKAIRRRIWEANHMFRRMLFKGFVPDVVTYNCLINGLCKSYRIERAHEVFDEMLQRGCVPNRVTYNSFIRYYSVVNEVDKGVEMMRAMVARNHGMPTSSSYTPIIHSLCEAGRVEEARDFLVEMVRFGSVPREYTYKLVCDALRRLGEDGFGADLRRRIEDGIDARFRSVMRVKPIMQRPK
ncbi:TPR-like protein [Dioscorea alata]|uniref:TPR-like protein n=2 Tax=Dioscorea alata TaxID=55571 RepID=A0ACB7UZC0_DIOAL|nr:TPR-like protein [Dioscorea alata]KAH7666141.1 TPR-like protein [Dioscorea alata]